MAAELKDHIALAKLYKDGWITGTPDHFKILVNHTALEELYKGQSAFFERVLVTVVEGLRRSGYKVVSSRLSEISKSATESFIDGFQDNPELAKTFTKASFGTVVYTCIYDQAQEKQSER